MRLHNEILIYLPWGKGQILFPPLKVLQVILSTARTQSYYYVRQTCDKNVLKN